tara:strand:+ start:39 stop:1634 length:1596 start_codon:yes stop_codon:yes gene_type:complete
MTVNLQLKPSDMNITHKGVEPFVGLNLGDVNKFRDSLTYNITSYLQSVNIENDKDGEILWLSSSYFIKEMMGLFTSWYFTNEIAKKNYTVSGSEFIKSLLNNDKIENKPIVDFYLRGLPKPEAWKKNLRFIKSRVLKNNFPYCLPKMIKKNDIITFSKTRLIVEHSKIVSKRVVISKFNDWFSSGNWIKNSEKGITKKTEDLIVNFLVKAFEDSGNKNVSNEIIKYSREILIIICSRTNFFLNELKLNSKYLPNTLWISTAGLFYNRLMARVVMMNGGEVIAHDHGTGLGWVNTYITNLVEFNFINNFVTYSPGMVEGYKQKLLHKSCLNPNCNIISISKKNKLDCNNNFQKIKKKYNPKSVMYLSNLYEGDGSHLIPTMSDYLHVNWQANLFSFLHQHKFDIYFKPHPESHSLPPPYFEKMYDVKILKGMFHEFSNTADVVISDHPLSTAFIESLQYKLPTVLIYLPLYKISDKAINLLSKRCPIVEGIFDHNGKINVDFNAIKKAINNAKNMTEDNSFINYYLPFKMKI